MPGTPLVRIGGDERAQPVLDAVSLLLALVHQPLDLLVVSDLAI